VSAAPFDPLLSVFPCATDARTVADLPLSAIIDRMRGAELAEATGRICSAFAAAGGGAAGKRATEADKKRLPGVTLAGTFDRRANAAWRDPSGLVQLDLDNLTPAELAEARALLLACPWVACLWASPSGAGLKGAVRVCPVLLPDPTRYTEAWRGVSRWLASVGLLNDPAAKDCARLAFLAHDPEAMHNPEAVAFPLDDWAEPEPVRDDPPPRSEPRAVPEHEAERRAMAYAQRMPPSVEGSNGSAALTAAVRALRDGFDLTGAGLWRCLDAWNASHASPPWSRAELEHALASVEAEPAKRGRGWLLNAEPTRAEARAASDPWPAPVPIRSAAEPPGFDLLAMIPRDLPELADLVDAGAEALQVPRELIAGAAVGLAALACSRAVEVELAPGWREPAPLWVLPLLRPGERKSASLGMLCRPFHDWALGERKRLAEPLARFMERRRCMEAELGALRTRAAKGSGEAAAKARADALDLAAELDGMPARLAAPDLLVQSFTPEGLRDMLEANGERVGIVSAEADAAELMGARYSDAGPSIDLLLCAHAGDPITTRRAGGRVVPLDRPAVGMVLAVQPEAVRAVLGDRAAKGRGLIDRMLLILPPSRMGSRLLDPAPVPAAVSEWWAESIGRLLNLPWPGRCIVGHDGEPRRCTSQPRILTVTPEAREHLWRLRAELEPRLAEGADLAPVSGFASKLPGACARLALAFAMLRDPGAEVVDGESMRAACAWAPFLLAHHRAVLGDAAEPAEAHHARRLWRAIQRRGRATMTARDLFRLVEDSAVPTMADFRPVLDLLREHGAVRPAAGEDGRPGRPAELWQINPALLPSDMSDTSRDMEGAA
jgi:hypothetical protein